MCSTSPEILKVAKGALRACTVSEGAQKRMIGAQSMSHTATQAPPNEDLHPETSIFGSTGENASAAGVYEHWHQRDWNALTNVSVVRGRLVSFAGQGEGG
jgi:hypothetical protein